MASPSEPVPTVARAGRLLAPLAMLGLVAAVIGGSDRFPGADGPHALAQAMRLGRLLRAGELAQVGDLMAHLAAPQPPVGYLPLVALAALDLPVRALIVLGDLVLLALTWDGLRRLAAPIPAWSSTLAWALAVSAPLTWWAADHYGFDLVASATTLQTLGWLHASEGLARPGPRRAFALWLSLAFLSKYTTPIILVVPVLWGCAPALWRRPKALLEAVCLWALVALPYYLVNHATILHYLSQSFLPPDLPGNLPPAMGWAGRLGPGQLRLLGGLVDGTGLPLLLLLAAGAARERRLLPILAVLGGLGILGMMNEQQGRYTLPLVFLLGAAAAPRTRPGGAEAAIIALVGLLTLRGTAGTFAETTAARAPPNRAMGGEGGHLVGWPTPATSFRPISERVDAWRVPEVVTRAAGLVPTASALVVAIDAVPTAPAASVYMLVAEELDRPFDLLALHLAEGEAGLRVNAYLGPFPTRFVPDWRPWEGLELVYAVRPIGGAGAVSAWLDTVSTELVERFELPEGHEGLLLRLRAEP